MAPQQPPSPGGAPRDEEERMYANGIQSLQELDEQYPSRPHNHALTMPFAELFKSLFNPLTKGGPTAAPAKARRGATKVSPTEQRRTIIERFFSRWRNEVGNDIYPAMRLILPDQDRDRSVYRLKEQTIAKLLIKLMRISQGSEDGQSLINWKVPGKSASSRLAGDFAGRCFEALNKRPLRTDPGEMRVGEVNELLDKLSAAAGEAEQMPIFEKFYQRMNPEEMQWLIRIILKQMKIGATEKTMLNAWHPDGEKLFNVSSSLRHVCWELWDPEVSLEEDKSKLSLMSCFQPQLARFALTTTFEKMVQKLRLQDGRSDFYIEEKLDGERMQLHMQKDDDAPGGFRFGFWSRKGKNYTYLYGESFEDENGSVTRYLKGAFDDRVRECILDGEMIAWDPVREKMLAFGTLKTSALSVQKNPYDNQGANPLYRVFDCLYVNGKDLTGHSLENRREALATILPDSQEVSGRFEKHPYKIAKSSSDIEPMLREIVENSSEGLVLKNPDSVYRLNQRPDDWIKVKPEYLTEFGENLDCVVIGGYYGSGRRGGTKSSFLCGLRASPHDVEAGITGPETFYSFFKVGGGLTAADYAEIEHHTEGKWHTWNPKTAGEYVVLAGGDRYFERPDVWIRPSDSLVLEVKAASAESTTSFRVGQTLRFPRFRKIRFDKKWDDGALNMDEWHQLKERVDDEVKEKKDMAIENRRKRSTKRQKRELTVAGEAQFVPVVAKSKLFDGKKFYIPAGSANPKKSKDELKKLVMQNGGTFVEQSAKARDEDVIVLLDRPNTAYSQTVMNMEEVNIITPKWMLDCIKHNYILPWEEDDLFRATDDMYEIAAQNKDQYGDSYYRDVDLSEMRDIFERMSEANGGRKAQDMDFDKEAFYDQLEAQGHELPQSRGYIFRRCHVYFAPVQGITKLTIARLQSMVSLGNGRYAEVLHEDITHVVVISRGDNEGARKVAAGVRKAIRDRERLRIPRIVTDKWIDDCWEEETRVSEEGYAPV